MGNLNVYIPKTREESQAFIRHLLKDVQALDYMLKENWFENDITRIGAEQEICLVNSDLKPAHKSIELLEKINHDDIVTELANFNLEFNLTPLEFKGDCFSQLENEILQHMKTVNFYAEEIGVKAVMAGILPTIRKTDVTHENITPYERYHLLIDVLSELRGGKFDFHIRGIDEFSVKHESAFMEACNTSFQVHLQVKPEEFVDKYNLAQVIAAPMMAISVNSPLLFGKRLWHETRIALFQQSLETRKKLDHLRDRSPRVVFGNDWLKKSVTEIYREDIARFKVLLNADIEVSSTDMIKNGEVPPLTALNIHNGTVYRWNRPCYGISKNGKPHLRIENRIIPAGPTAVDEVANSAFWFGLMHGLEANVADEIKRLQFDNVKNNFFTAARYGINSSFYWIDGQQISARKLIEERLLPIAERGLQKFNVDDKDIKRYLGVIEERVRKGTTGASWALESFNELIKTSGKDEATATIVAKSIEKQELNEPVHTWELASMNSAKWDFSPNSLKVEEFMATDLFTAHPSDLIELVANIIEWNKIRYLPVEDDHGKLAGVLSSRMLLKHFHNEENPKDFVVEDIMKKNPITVYPDQTVLDTINLMQENQIGCLPVVDRDEKLVGVVTELEFLKLSSRIMKRMK